MSGNHKLLELCLSPDLGGLELYMLKCADALSEDFDVIKVINTQGKLFERCHKEANTYTLQRRSKLFLFNSARILAKIIDEHKIDVMHIHWTKDLPLAVMAKLISKQKPKLVQSRHMTMTRFKNDFYHRFLYKQMEMILPVTQQLADQINKFIPKDICPKNEVLYIGSDKPKILDTKEIQAYKNEIGMLPGEFVVGMIGRIEEPKGQFLLIEAMQVLKEAKVPSKVFFVGHAMQEHYQEKLEAMIQKMKLQDEIVFLGFIKEPQRFMQACDVVVLATTCETFGLVLVEAMRVGTAVVATNACGPLEIIDDKENGLLFEVGSSKSLSEKLNWLYKNEAERLKMAQLGKEKAECMFSNEKQFKELAKRLREI